MAEAAEIQSKHRRNLMFLSTLFFLYVFTGSSLTDLKDIRVYFISAEISRPEVLIYFSWLLLVWYFYRFWLSCRGNNTVNTIVHNQLNVESIFRDYFLSQIHKQYPDRPKIRLELTKPIRVNSRYVLETNRVLEMNEGETSWKDAKGIERQLDITAIVWRYLVVRRFIKVSFAKSTEFWDSIFPYIFSLSAMFAGLWRWKY